MPFTEKVDKLWEPRYFHTFFHFVLVHIHAILLMDQFFSIIFYSVQKDREMSLLAVFTPGGKCESSLKNENSKTRINGNDYFLHSIFPDVYFSLT